LPLILLVSQTVSQKALQPPRDPKKVLTDQEQISQGIINYLPFIVAFFSVNVPAGLAIYWIVNNVMTTLITLATKASIKQAPFPTEVSRMMTMIESGPGKMQQGKRSSGLSSGKAELRTGVIERKPSAKAADGGFSAAAASPFSAAVTEGVGADASAAGAENPSVMASAGGVDIEEEEEEDESSSPSEPERKRKKRVKPASKKGKK
jgi:YidC/Oxa1 family membrane protein insertase